VQKCLASLLAIGLDSKLVAGLASLLRAEAQKPGIAASNAFVLVEWCSVLMQQLAGGPQWDPIAFEVILANAAALERCFQPPARSTVSESALVVTRRGLRKLFSAEDHLEKTITEAVRHLTAKGPQPTAKNAVLLGVIAGVASRKVHAIPVLEAVKGGDFGPFRASLSSMSRRWAIRADVEEDASAASVVEAS